MNFKCRRIYTFLRDFASGPSEYDEKATDLLNCSPEYWDTIDFLQVVRRYGRYLKGFHSSLWDSTWLITRQAPDKVLCVGLRSWRNIRGRQHLRGSYTPKTCRGWRLVFRLILQSRLVLPVNCSLNTRSNLPCRPNFSLQWCVARCHAFSSSRSVTWHRKYTKARFVQLTIIKTTFTTSWLRTFDRTLNKIILLINNSSEIWTDQKWIYRNTLEEM